MQSRMDIAPVITGVISPPVSSPGADGYPQMDRDEPQPRVTLDIGFHRMFSEELEKKAAPSAQDIVFDRMFCEELEKKAAPSAQDIVFHRMFSEELEKKAAPSAQDIVLNRMFSEELEKKAAPSAQDIVFHRMFSEELERKAALSAQGIVSYQWSAELVKAAAEATLRRNEPYQWSPELVKAAAEATLRRNKSYQWSTELVKAAAEATLRRNDSYQWSTELVKAAAEATLRRNNSYQWSAELEKAAAEATLRRNNRVSSIGKISGIIEHPQIDRDVLPSPGADGHPQMDRDEPPPALSSTDVTLSGQISVEVVDPMDGHQALSLPQATSSDGPLRAELIQLRGIAALDRDNSATALSEITARLVALESSNQPRLMQIESSVRSVATRITNLERASSTATNSSNASIDAINQKLAEIEEQIRIMDQPFHPDKLPIIDGTESAPLVRSLRAMRRSLDNTKGATNHLKTLLIDQLSAQTSQQSSFASDPQSRASPSPCPSSASSPAVQSREIELCRSELESEMRLISHLTLAPIPSHTKIYNLVKQWNNIDCPRLAKASRVVREALPYSLILYSPDSDPKPDTYVLVSAWYGVVSTGGQAGEALDRLALEEAENYPNAVSSLSLIHI